MFSDVLFTLGWVAVLAGITLLWGFAALLIAGGALAILVAVAVIGE